VDLDLVGGEELRCYRGGEPLHSYSWARGKVPVWIIIISLNFIKINKCLMKREVSKTENV